MADAAVADPAGKLILGAAGLGMAYGRPGLDGGAPVAPDPGRVAATCEAAWNLGFRIADTAPAYGVSEEMLGRFWPGAIWTKNGPDGLDASLQCLRRERVELLQWHNWHADLIDDPDFQAWLVDARDDDRVELLGATVYGQMDAKAAIELGAFAVVQCAWNVCDQGTVKAVVASACAQGVCLAGRSIYLQGLLLGRQPPMAADAGRPALQAFARLAVDTGCSPAALALRAALACEDLDYVLLGLDDPEQLTPVSEALASPALDDELRQALARFDAEGAAWTDPRTWS